jgi:hypothetical protein
MRIFTGLLVNNFMPLSSVNYIICLQDRYHSLCTLPQYPKLLLYYIITHYDTPLIKPL